MEKEENIWKHMGSEVARCIYEKCRLLYGCKIFLCEVAWLPYGQDIILLWFLRPGIKIKRHT